MCYIFENVELNEKRKKERKETFVTQILHNEFS